MSVVGQARTPRSVRKAPDPNIVIRAFRFHRERLISENLHAAFPPGEAREDWKILRAASEALGKQLPYDTLDQLRQALVKACPSFAAIDQVEPASWGAFGTAGELDAAPFASPVENFYMTDPISRASATMAECTETFVVPRRRAAARTGTAG